MLARLHIGLKVTAGFLLLIVGGILAIPGVPGPGILVIILGLVLLSDHFEWARKSLHWAREKAKRVTKRPSTPATTSKETSGPEQGAGR